MSTLRKGLSWVFAFTSVVCLQIAFWPILLVIYRQHTIRVANLLVLAVFTTLAGVFGMAWWTVLKGKRSARRWGIAASLINILTALLPAIFVERSIQAESAILLGTGFAGLVAFSRAYEPADATGGEPQNLRIAGDGTSGLLNKIVGPLLFVACFAAYSWWIAWLRGEGIQDGRGIWQQTVMILVIVFAITTIHEIAHTTTGLALGMKLRAFLVGPFQWRIRDGKWNFEFKPAEILSLSGATGVVPARADFPSWSFVCVLAAGPLANLLTGLLALWTAFAAGQGSPVQAGGSLCLFGAWSLVVGGANLVPFRTKHNYSDGATMYQLLAGGAWGDFHRVVAIVTSSLVTSLRPRDYDIQALLRAGRHVTQGHRGLLLRLYAYTYFLDRDRMAEAGEALREAESIYHESASDIPAELHTVFVFGSAYVLRDGAAAREWWARMEAKKPTRLNVDYWRAKGALHWIEGNLKEADEAWAKSNALAQRLPEAGAYEFDRYCCSLLRKVLDGTATRATSETGA